MDILVLIILDNIKINTMKIYYLNCEIPGRYNLEDVLS